MPQKKDWSTIQIREDVKNNFVPSINSDIFPEVLSLIDSLFP